MSIVQHSQEVLPHDIFEHIILPDLLSQHLHDLLVDPVPPTWHAFYVLPLVSKSFHETCQSLVSKMFGLKQRSDDKQMPDPEGSEDFDDFDDFDDPDDSGPTTPESHLDYAMAVWERSRHPATETVSLHQFERDFLLQDRSLIRVYTCLALGKQFLNTDILLPLGATATGEPAVNVLQELAIPRPRRTAWDEDYADENDAPIAPSPMEEGSMHRCYMPFECAQLICDVIAPARLTFVLAQHMARVLPLYHMLPLLAKYAADLRFNVAREYKLGPEDYAEWTMHTLDRLEDIDRTLGEMMAFGALVRSFWDEGGIPRKAFELTRILVALDDVVRADWGVKTRETRRRASALIRRWTA